MARVSSLAEALERARAPHSRDDGARVAPLPVRTPPRGDAERTRGFTRGSKPRVQTRGVKRVVALSTSKSRFLMIDGMHDGVTDRTRLDAGEFSVDVSSPSIEGLGDGTVLVFENGGDAEGPLAKTRFGDADAFLAGNLGLGEGVGGGKSNDEFEGGFVDLVPGDDLAGGGGGFDDEGSGAVGGAGAGEGVGGDGAEFGGDERRRYGGGGGDCETLGVSLWFHVAHEGAHARREGSEGGGVEENVSRETRVEELRGRRRVVPIDASPRGRKVSLARVSVRGVGKWHLTRDLAHERGNSLGLARVVDQSLSTRRIRREAEKVPEEQRPSERDGVERRLLGAGGGEERGEIFAQTGALGGGAEIGHVCLVVGVRGGDAGVERAFDFIHVGDARVETDDGGLHERVAR